jgi:hypothetical protein
MNVLAFSDEDFRIECHIYVVRLTTLHGVMLPCMVLPMMSIKLLSYGELVHLSKSNSSSVPIGLILIC